MSEGGVNRNERRRPVRIEWSFLTADEVKYELFIRGVSFRDNASLVELTELLVKNGDKPKNSELISKVPVADDLNYLDNCGRELRCLCRGVMSDQVEHEEPSRLGSLYLHCIGRISGIRPRVRGEESNELQRQIGNLSAVYSSLLKHATRYSYPPPFLEEPAVGELVSATRQMTLAGEEENRRGEEFGVERGDSVSSFRNASVTPASVETTTRRCNEVSDVLPQSREEFGEREQLITGNGDIRPQHGADRNVGNDWDFTVRYLDGTVQRRSVVNRAGRYLPGYEAREEGRWRQSQDEDMRIVPRCREGRRSTSGIIQSEIHIPRCLEQMQNLPEDVQNQPRRIHSNVAKKDKKRRKKHPQEKKRYSSEQSTESTEELSTAEENDSSENEDVRRRKRRSKKKSKKRTRKDKKKRSRKREKKKKKEKKSSTFTSHSSSASESSEEESTNSSSDTSSSSKHRRHARKNPVTFWKCRFSGKEDVATFLEDVEEQAEIHRVPERELLKGISSLLEGDAKIWFRGRRDALTTWDAFRRMIKKVFSQGDDDDSLLDRLRKMKQRAEESFEVYEARMNALFRRLDDPLDERKQVKLLMKGLQLYYRSRLCERDIPCLSALRKKCRRLEVDKAQILKLERERDKDTFNREKQEKSNEERMGSRREGGKRIWHTNEAEEGGAVKGEEVQIEAIASGMIMECWRCNRSGHLANQCKQQLFCQMCGQPGEATDKCSRCLQAFRQGMWRSQQNFQQGVWNAGTQAPMRFPFPPPVLHQPPATIGPQNPVTRDNSRVMTPAQASAKSAQSTANRNSREGTHK